MEKLDVVFIFIYFFSLLGSLVIFLFNPVVVWIISYLSGDQPSEVSALAPDSVSMIIVTRNAANLITEKIENSLSLHSFANRCEIVVYSDGSTDDTVARACQLAGVRVIASPVHKGKHAGMNAAVRESRGEILIFTDVDAMLEPEALVRLLSHFEDPCVGGVCGQRVLTEEGKELQEAQTAYIGFDSYIKLLESRLGSISSNDGKLYAIRRELFVPVPPAVTDDLYVSLSVIRKGWKFLYEPEARAFIRVPSRSRHHEMERRRRIVSTSLRGIFIMKDLLNPCKYGWFSLRLLSNKVIRRVFPLLLLTLFISSLFLYTMHAFFLLTLLAQGAFYLLALLYGPVLRHRRVPRVLEKASSIAYYFCLGNYGTLLGLIDFLSGRMVEKWEPVKTD